MPLTTNDDNLDSSVKMKKSKKRLIMNAIQLERLIKNQKLIDAYQQKVFYAPVYQNTNNYYFNYSPNAAK